MNKDEAMKLALEALEVEDMACRYEKDPTPEHIAKAITALREALAEQPAQTDWEAVAADQALTIALLKAEQPAPVQQRLKLVPYEPSIDMQEHGSIASGYDLSQTRAKKVYQAMIDMHDVMMEREPTDEWFRLQAGYPEQPAQQDGPINEGWHITVTNGHSGYGVYAHMKDYPEEGAVLVQTIEAAHSIKENT